MIRLLRKFEKGISRLSLERKNKKRIVEYYGRGKEIVAFLSSEFGVEHILLTENSNLTKNVFPTATTFNSSKLQGLYNWVLIYDKEIDKKTQEAVYENSGMCVAIYELITLFEQITPGKLPLVLNEIGNAYSSLVICGSSVNAHRVYEYYSEHFKLPVKLVPPKELEKAINLNDDEIVILADLLPDPFRLFELPKTVYVQWQHIVGDVQMTDEVFDIKERIIPQMIEAGVNCVCIALPKLSMVKHRFKVWPSVVVWKIIKKHNFSDYVRKIYKKFHTENLTEEHLDIKARRDKGYAEKYHNGKYINYDNGFRRTVGAKANFKKRIFFFGPCIVIGAYVSDENTIPSLMQKKLGDDYLLINRGQPNAIGLNLLMRSIEFQPGDTVFYFGKDAFLEGHVNYSLNSTYEKIDHIEKHITDSLMHCDSVVNKQIAEDLTRIYLEKYENNIRDSKNESLSFGASIKTPPELYMLKNPQFESYIDSIREYRKDGNNGAIVMNCNPFTNGHLFLITEAAKRVDTLYIFVVEEDKSFFPFADRIELVRKGTAHIKNVCVLNSGQFVISSTTLPGYFEKDQVGDIYLDASNDMMLFLQIAKAMNIHTRFAGSEPIDKFTNQYNANMRKYLQRYGVGFVEIERMQNEGDAISASLVRKCLKEKDFETIKKIVPETTYQYILEKFGD